ncbi:MAG TPA: ectonucleotide pyrophosphatase/phosphodiesterase [Candidatus Acidoferrum sp.]|jgi:predicted AlkP superfamily pyrophosphatase or phosphodiesterase|nr:ectonucleotide pyrophosphatase/phosphodiesterase [Candidatus Acidoferrum sp.]
MNQSRNFPPLPLRDWRTRAWFTLLILIMTAATCGAQSASTVVEVSNPPNTAEQQAKHYVVLVSLDGFRYDYPAKYGAKNLQEMATRGASAPEGMFPMYPSVTFPNHYSIVTGLYPDHHGIVANSFYDPARKENYSYTNPKTTGDGSWYGGTPLWVLAEKQGMRAATFFWPTSDAEIQGKRSSYYVAPYDDSFPDEKRIDQVLSWLRLPPEKRPHFIALYYPNTDHAGHAYGPDARETAEAVRHVDDMIGKLSDGIAALGLPVDLIVVADHGMETLQGGWLILDKWADLSQFETSGPLLYAKSEADAEKAYRALLGGSDKFKVYRRAQVPADLHFNSNAREGDPVVVPTGPYNIVAHDPNSNGGTRTPPRGGHGYDPRQMPSMKAIFFAAGSDIRPGVTVTAFENINVYPLIAAILGLQTGPIDGKLGVLQGILKKNSKN